MAIKLYLLPGFLGIKEDFKELKFKKYIDPLFVDLYAFADPLEGMDHAVHAFSKTLSKKNTNILLGYSLGGRFALHCLKKKDSLFHGAIFISTHPGLKTEEEKKERYESDQKWADAFGKTAWLPLMESWNCQSVFSKNRIDRQEKDYSRVLLKNTFLGWSLAKQENFTPFVKEVKCPILWITGEKDHKFSNLASSLEFSHVFSKKIEIQGASHRVHLETPLELSKILDTFFQNIL
jgi:2-succinyl-6-hydroxy-2,4-cyclohexadiene-1-carboxylate synthase